MTRRSPWIAIVADLGWLPMCAAVIVTACDRAPPPPDPDVHRAEVEAWHEWRSDELTRPYGMLALVGLHWLQVGDNTVGSDPGSDIVLPERAPGQLGVFRLGRANVRLDVLPGIDVFHNNEPVASSFTWSTELAGQPPMVAVGSLALRVIGQSPDFAVQVADSLSPERLSFSGADRYPIDVDWRVSGRFDRYDPPRTLPTPTVFGDVHDEPSPGAVVFRIDGRDYRLETVGEVGDSVYFIAFGDASNGSGTYGGGRFVLIDAPDARGRTFIDFNRAYNPPCFYSPYAMCPLPPPQNRLDVRIDAGEQDRYSTKQ